jgi:hypothetical protein
MIVRLDRDAFASALRAGRGAALMHVEAYGLDGVDDLVLATCLENQAYDPQCEDSRAPWLYQMFKDSSIYRSDFEQVICDAIVEEAEYHDRNQQCDLLSLIALGGNFVAAERLRAFVYGQQLSVESPNNFYGYAALVRLDGCDAALQLINRMGYLLLDDPEEYVPDLESLTDGGLCFNEVESAMARCADKDEAIGAYLHHHQKTLEKKKAIEVHSKEDVQATRRSQMQQQRPITKLFEVATTGNGFSRVHWMFAGRCSMPEEREKVLKRIVDEPNPEVCARLLSYFQRAELPYLDPRLWELAQDSESSVRDAALKALAGVSDASIGEFARQTISEKPFSAEDSEVLRLFERNFIAEDEALLLDVVKNLHGDDSHYVSLIILDICNTNKAQPLISLAEWVYRVTPCSICRRSAVNFLVDISSLPVEFADECLFDVDVDTQAVAREYLNRSATH